MKTDFNRQEPASRKGKYLEKKFTPLKILCLLTKSNAIYLLSFFLILSCSSLGLSGQEKGHSIPIHNYYEYTSLTPIKINRSDYSKFRRKIYKVYRKKINYIYRSKDHTIVLADKETILAFKTLRLSYEEVGKYPPFRYYVPDYQTRLKNGFRELSDLKTGYKDYKLNIKYLKALAKEYPNLVTYYDLGKTRLGRPIPAIRITSPVENRNKISVLFNGAHHSNELIGVEHCYDVIYHLLSDPEKYSEVLDRMNIWVIPIVNPDGSYLFWYKSLAMGRKNGYLAPGFTEDNYARGIDLNRNYPFKWNSGHPKASSGNPAHSFYRGPSPGSEPETRALMALAEKERFLFSISFHSFATKLLFPYTIEDTTNPNPDYVQDLAKRLVKFTKSYHPVKRFEAVKNIYAVDGTDQDYFYYKFGTNALLAESSHRNIDYGNIGIIMDGFRPLWENLLNEYLQNVKMILRVEDIEGYPLEASIRVEGFEYFEGEKFTTHPVTGYFFKMLMEEKEYFVHISSPGYKERVVKVLPGVGFEPKIVQLRKISDTTSDKNDETN